MDEDKSWRNGLKKEMKPEFDPVGQVLDCMAKKAAYGTGRRVELYTSQAEQVAPNPKSLDHCYPILRNFQRPTGEGSDQRHQVSSRKRGKQGTWCPEGGQELDT